MAGRGGGRGGGGGGAQSGSTPGHIRGAVCASAAHPSHRGQAGPGQRMCPAPSTPHPHPLHSTSTGTALYRWRNVLPPGLEPPRVVCTASSTTREPAQRRHCSRAACCVHRVQHNTGAGTAAPLLQSRVLCAPRPVQHGSRHSGATAPEPRVACTASSTTREPAQRRHCSRAACCVHRVQYNTGAGTAAPLLQSRVLCAPRPVQHGSRHSGATAPEPRVACTASSTTREPAQRRHCSRAACCVHRVQYNTGAGTAAPLLQSRVLCAPRPVQHGSRHSGATAPEPRVVCTTSSTTREPAQRRHRSRAACCVHRVQYNTGAGTAAPPLQSRVLCAPRSVQHGSRHSGATAPEPRVVPR